jgi:hypothetical protein
MSPKCILTMIAAASVSVGLAQQQPPPTSYPPPQQGYPQQQQQGYPPPGYPAQGQPPYGQPPRLAPQQLDQMVQRIALYPDPLLAQVLTASTFWNQIPDAANWVAQHNYLRGDELSRAIYEDNLGFDPSVMALLPFPSVLDMMARDPGWTQALGSAVLGQRPEVMDAVQRMRQVAMNYGYLQSNGDYRVVDQGPGDIEIVPISSGLIYVPYYDPLIVFAPPRRGFYIGGAISFGPGIFVGAFAPFGWAGPGLGWRTHEILIDHRPWERTWVNRDRYVHSYAVPVPRAVGPRVEHHESREVHRDRR